MSASGSAAGLRNLIPFKPGHDPRRQVGPKLSPAELKFREAIDAEVIPEAIDALKEAMVAGRTALAEGDLLGGTKALEFVFKAAGLFKKPTDDAAIAEMAKAVVGEMIAEVRARRADAGSTG